MEGTIRVTASAKSTITAVSARLHLKIDGERAIFGNAALEQAKELKEFVTRLKALGLEESAVSLKAVRVSAPGGLLKASKAEFNLVVTESRLERLPQVIGAVSDTKNAELQQLEWQWDDFAASVPLAAEAMRKARSKAVAMAEASGATVTGVRNASDSWSMPESVVVYDAVSAAPMSLARARSAPSADIGMEYRAERDLEVSVTVDFAVSS